MGVGFGFYMYVSPKWCKIGGNLVLIINRKPYMIFRFVPKWVTLNGLELEMALFCVNFKKFGNFRGILCKSHWQSHNYRQFTISSNKLLQRDRVTPKVSFTSSSRLINSRLNAQYWPSYRFDKKSEAYINFRLVQISVTLNDLKRRNSPYFALFHGIRVRCHPSS